MKNNNLQGNILPFVNFFKIFILLNLTNPEINFGSTDLSIQCKVNYCLLVGKKFSFKFGSKSCKLFCGSACALDHLLPVGFDVEC